MLGYCIFPAIAAQAAEDHLSEADIVIELANAQTKAKQLLVDCEVQRPRLKNGGKTAYATIKSGHSELYDLLIDADRISQRALQVVA